MTDKQKLEFGFEIIAGMHAEIADQDMEYGRAETAEGLALDPDCPPEYIESHSRGVELANIRINRQAPFMANVVLAKLEAMGFELKENKNTKNPPSIVTRD
ncbi:hypothetical protein [Dyadobacter sp. LHD-138]|uniref:hypothetical protein n=1 Tax=Dyadobacter sp. LHD-138 TaxID=3071413 RepID=UPI0027DFB28C|nr:hypothetical protein [Dyadobacter sp. LHD-138]MDQ6477815.1 hypothetical protein [Dyadobacter sp. LHD-138]